MSDWLNRDGSPLTAGTDWGRHEDEPLPSPWLGVQALMGGTKGTGDPATCRGKSVRGRSSGLRGASFD